MVKLVVSDLDGTLIDSSEQLTDTAREMARWLKDRNVLFTFATGRVQGMTERYAQDMQVSIPYVASNGAALIAPDGVLFRRKVPLKPLETMLRKADSMGMSIIYSEDGYEKVCRETPYILRQRAAFGRYNDVAPLTQADYDGKQMEKICVMDSDKTGDKIDYVEDFIRHLGDQYSYTRYGDKAVEIVHPGCTKAAGVAELAKRLNIPMSDVLAIGDDENDLQMLRLAGHTATVQNALAKVKPLVAYVSPYCHSAGVFDAVKHFIGE